MPDIKKMSFSRVYPLYIAKAERKGRTKAEVDRIIIWLTGYNDEQLETLARSEISLEEFFDSAPNLNPNRALIKGTVCGIKVHEIEDETIRNIRYLDKLVDELAKGKTIEKILRGSV